MSSLFIVIIIEMLLRKYLSSDISRHKCSPPQRSFLSAPFSPCPLLTYLYAFIAYFLFGVHFLILTFTPIVIIEANNQPIFLLEDNLYVKVIVLLSTVNRLITLFYAILSMLYILCDFYET